MSNILRFAFGTGELVSDLSCQLPAGCGYVIPARTAFHYRKAPVHKLARKTLHAISRGLSKIGALMRIKGNEIYFAGQILELWPVQYRHLFRQGAHTRW